MKTRFLFPHRFKLMGWILFVPAFVAGLCVVILQNNFPISIKCKIFEITGGLLGNGGYFKFGEENIFPDTIAILLIAGGLFIGFSKVKDEDEYIARIRLESLVWATYVNYGLLILTFLFIYGEPFLTVMEINMFTILIFFLIRFHYFLWKSRKSLRYEKQS